MRPDRLATHSSLKPNPWAANCEAGTKGGAMGRGQRKCPLLASPTSNISSAARPFFALGRESDALTLEFLAGKLANS